MTRTAADHKQPRREVTIALLGLVGVIATGTFSNWDKLFPRQNVISATVDPGYRPTGNFQTELRYYFDASGARQMLESMQHQLLINTKNDLIAKNPEDAEAITKALDAVEKEAIRLDDVIRELMPVYQKHFTVTEMQELNKFYSTEVMQGMVKKLPLVTQDAAPIQVRLMNEYFERLGARLQSVLGP